MIATTPAILFSDMKDNIAINNGTNSISIKPIAEPAPCIFEAVVTASFVSPTLKKQVKIQAPTANIPIRDTVIMLNVLDVSLYRLWIEGVDSKNRMPATNIHMLNGTRTGLLLFPNALIAIVVWQYSL